MHYFAGPRITSSYAGNYYRMRTFAHVLLRVGSVTEAGVSSQQGLELLVGAGVDFWVLLRVQADYLRLPTELRDPNGNLGQQYQVRIMVGGVVPLCSRGCRPTIRTASTCEVIRAAPD